jgi:hypothetical protein
MKPKKNLQQSNEKGIDAYTQDTQVNAPCQATSHTRLLDHDKKYMKRYNTPSLTICRRVNRTFFFFFEYLYDFALACSLAARINLNKIRNGLGRRMEFGTVKEILGNRFFEGMGLEGEHRNLVVFQDLLRDIDVGIWRTLAITLPDLELWGFLL